MSKTDFFKKSFICGAPYKVVFRKYKVFWIMLVDFNLTLLNSIPGTHLQIQAASRIEVVICFFYGAPCKQHFYRVKCSKSFFAW